MTKDKIISSSSKENTNKDKSKTAYARRFRGY